MPLDAPSARLRTYIQESLLNGKSVCEDDNLLMSGLIDSLGIMSLVAYIEDTFSIRVPFEDVIIENFVSISAMTAYIAKRQSV